MDLSLFESIIALTLIVFMVVNVGIVWVLFRLSRKSGFLYPALNERLISASIKTVGSLFLAVLGLGRLSGITFGEIGLVLLSAAVVLHSLPPIVWWFYYQTGRFHQAVENEFPKVE